MLDKKVSEVLNDQINKELYSAYLYLDFSLYYQEQGLDGFANWYMIQTQEERDHAMLLLQYLQNNGEHITLKQVDKPDKVCGALKKDYRTMQFLDWFVKEQGEEEKNAEDMVKKFELFGTDPKSLYMLDNEMAGRAYSAPSLVL